MSMKDLNTYCVEGILDFSSNYDVSTFEEGFPKHQEAVKFVWTRRPEVNVDDAMIKDAAKLLQVIRRHKKLKRLTCKRMRENKFSFKLRAAIASNCSELEVLDIPELQLSSDDITLLNSCNSLKRMNIAYASKATKSVEEFIAKNPQLESIRLNYLDSEGWVTNNLFENFPQTVRQVEIFSYCSPLENYNSFWNRVQTWKLEKLEMNQIFTEDHILILSKQTTLKYLNICFREVGNSLGILFRNNTSLEEVTLTSCSVINDTCLKYLPPSLKSLKCLGWAWDLDDETFVDSVKTWNLQSLSLNLEDNFNLVMRALNAAPSLTDIYIDTWDTLSDQNLINVEKLAQLKVLHLENHYKEQNNWLQILLENCVNLQELQLRTEFFDRNMFSVIAAFPELKQFRLLCKTYRSVDYVNCLQDLSKSKSLTTVEFEFCNDLIKKNILMLIKHSKTFTKLVLECSVKIRELEISNTFLNNVVQEMKKQNDRTDVLNLVIISQQKYLTKRSTTNLHPMLNLEFIGWNCYA